MIAEMCFSPNIVQSKTTRCSWYFLEIYLCYILKLLPFIPEGLLEFA